EQRAEQAEQRAEQAEQRAEQAEQRAGQAEQRAQHFHNQLLAIFSTFSWKVSKPIRVVERGCKHLKQGDLSWVLFQPGSRTRRTIKILLAHLRLYIERRPALRSRVINVINRFPKLKDRLRNEMRDSFIEPITITLQHSHLSPRGQEIYMKLKKSIEENKIKSEK
ncbi:MULTISPECIES: alanine-zipper protein, partial [unclassified Francisella]|uniref:alanine-zipper protein n=1 Tax=unclassified Francisella TaxID=2610885 RepID=UPI002E36E2B8